MINMGTEDKSMEWIHTQALMLKAGTITFMEWLEIMGIWASEQENKSHTAHNEDTTRQ